MPFANGGVVTGPTTFPMRGRTGLMGEGKHASSFAWCKCCGAGIAKRGASRPGTPVYQNDQRS